MESAQKQAWLGSVLIAASAVAYSTAGYFTRLIDLDICTMLFWRGLFGGVFIGICIACAYGRETFAVVRQVGGLGLLVAALSALATICYLNALRLTTVADVMAINATSPFLSGLLAWLIIGEREHWKTVAASLVALVGVIVMVGPSAQAGNLIGALLAFVMTFAMASMVVVMRIKKSISMLPASCLSAFLSAVVIWPFSSPGTPTDMDMVFLFLFGTVQFGLGLVLLTIGTRYVTALRSSLLSRLQTVLAPVWVWVAFNEMPPIATLVGGSLVIGAAFAAALATKPSNSESTSSLRWGWSLGFRRVATSPLPMAASGLQGAAGRSRASI